MARRRIAVERDEATEVMTGVKLEGATVYYNDDDNTIKVLGELVSISADPIIAYREAHVIVYSTENDIIARDYANWIKFGIRQSFELEIDNEDPSLIPVKIKIFFSFQ